MFPLGTVLLPHMPLTLRIFEPRYRTLLSDRLEVARRGEPPDFGVVLIERGLEVGGGDQRFGLGTVARVTQVAPRPDGSFDLLAVGTDRLDVRAWLPDDPYPVADVDLLPALRFDEAADRSRLDRAESQVRRCLTLQAELGEPGWPPGVALDADPAAAAWQLAGVAPLGPLDHLALLGSLSLGDLLDDLGRLTAEAAEVLEFRLGG